MNRSQKFLGITLMASLLCGFTPMQSEAKEYKIGGMYTYDYHDGRHADWGEYELHAAKMAIEDINASGMLGGNIAVLATYTLLSNLTVATLSPLVFSLIGSQTALPFFESFGIVCRQMIPLLILPFVIAVLLKRFAPRIHRQLRERQQISFYLWAVALTIVMGNTVAFLMKQDASNYVNEIWMALLALAVCCAQFLAGRRIGRRYRNKIAGAQGLGQKNTILAIWMAQTYLTPIASVGPAAYVIWQNLINSYQLWAKRHREQGLPKKEPVKTPIGLPGTPVIPPQR